MVKCIQEIQKWKADDIQNRHGARVTMRCCMANGIYFMLPLRNKFACIDAPQHGSTVNAVQSPMATQIPPLMATSNSPTLSAA